MEAALVLVSKEHGQNGGAQHAPSMELPADTPLVPARMVNEYQYCPRLAYLEWVQGEWAESADTVEGRHAHRRVNRDGGTLPPPADVSAGDSLHARSITLSSDTLGLIARMDLIESDDAQVIPVDYKRGKRPHVKGGAYGPGARATLRAGAAPARARLPLRRRGAVLRRQPRASAGSVRRCADSDHQGGDHGSAQPRAERDDSAAAGGQPEVPALLPGRHLSAGRGQPSGAVVTRAAADRRPEHGGAAALRAGARRQGRQVRGDAGGDRR